VKKSNTEDVEKVFFTPPVCFATPVEISAYNGRTRSIDGALGDVVNGRQEIRIVGIDEYEISCDPHGDVIITHHIDNPGVIAHTSMSLYRQGINIDTAQLGQDQIGERAFSAYGVKIPERNREDTIESVLRAIRNPDTEVFPEVEILTAQHIYFP
tara:strand:+ start:781 stop:1245 length:465 start_codon:yes stop_codon:yes gene_type:complete